MWHVATVLALPLLSLLAGLASLYIDPAKEPGKKWILVALLLLGSAGTFAGSLSDDHEKSENHDAMLKQIDDIDALTRLTQGVSVKQDTMSDSLTRLVSGLGLDIATTNVLRRSISADSARRAILPAVQHTADTRSITVVYYPKNVDGPVVINALKEGGFQVETGTGNAHNAALATNAVWVGDGVSAEQAKFVALTLVRAGVGIVSIRRFKSDTAAKHNRIEVGTDATLLQATPLTVDQINALSDIARGSSSELSI
jgi:hypothetical protein